MRRGLEFLLGLACVLGGAASASAINLQGAAYILPSTSVGTCGTTCLFLGSNILEIADGDTSNSNGWAGADGVTGIIQLDLLGSFDLDSFSLWNDFILGQEGVGDFRLDFYDPSDQLIGSSSVYTAPVSQVAAGVYSFATVFNVSRVDLAVLTLLTGGSCCRIELREVAFTGEVTTVPEPSTLVMAALGVAALACWRRAR